jgi:hypothetical protein
MRIRVKVQLNQGEARSVKIGRGVQEECCLLQILFNIYSEYLTKEAVEWFGDFQIGQVKHGLRYVDDFLLLIKKERVLLWGMISRLTERCYGMEMNLEKTKVMRISRQGSPLQIMIDQ